ncbi:hypothetical protein GR131_31600 [Streptomyces sp. GF20]|uniref:HNH endonuclease signature motif containing protein n=1 Tax=Streptomyces sp. GF20 TaxID=2692235 RepID=UPI001316C4C3|nr:hypothetical protein GR131_31600 [Streptomyces sp. GF20]
MEKREADGRHEQRADTAGSRRARDREAREAVLLRSEGRCENPRCLLPALPYRTAAGGSLLEVDHIDDHARGGRDHPSAMIALCPNCHANKTRGAGRAALREHLRPVARALDAAQDSDAARAKDADAAPQQGRPGTVRRAPRVFGRRRPRPGPSPPSPTVSGKPAGSLRAARLPVGAEPPFAPGPAAVRPGQAFQPSPSAAAGPTASSIPAVTRAGAAPRRDRTRAARSPADGLIPWAATAGRPGR